MKFSVELRPGVADPAAAVKDALARIGIETFRARRSIDDPSPEFDLYLTVEVKDPPPALSPRAIVAALRQAENVAAAEIEPSAEPGE